MAGIRRSGKTTWMFQRKRELLAQGVDRKAICYIDFADDRLLGIEDEAPGVVADAYYFLFPDMVNKKVYFLFDEIDHLSHWDLFLNRLLNTKDCEVNVTGSSSKRIEQEVSTEFGGRKLLWHMYPYSFREFLRSRGVSDEFPHAVGRAEILVRELEEYMERGGFPECVDLPEGPRRKYLANTTTDIALRDISLRFNPGTPEQVRKLLAILAGQMACKTSITKLHNRINGMQVKTPRDAVTKTVSCARDVFFSFFAPIRTHNKAKRDANPKKVYLSDHSLAWGFPGLNRIPRGQVFENIIAVELARRLGRDEIFYWVTPKGYEIDFAVGPDDDISFVQACFDLGPEGSETLQREVRALEDALSASPGARAILVTLDNDKTISTDNGEIRVVPAWRFLLFGNDLGVPKYY